MSFADEKCLGCNRPTGIFGARVWLRGFDGRWRCENCVQVQLSDLFRRPGDEAAAAGLAHPDRGTGVCVGCGHSLDIEGTTLAITDSIGRGWHFLCSLDALTRPGAAVPVAKPMPRWRRLLAAIFGADEE